MKAFALVAVLAAVTALAPLAAAQDDAPADGGNAWVEDCPPDMMCAYSGGEEEKEPEGRGPADCAYCRGGTADDAPAADEGEPAWVKECADEMMCIAESHGRPAEPHAGAATAEDPKAVPLAGVAVVLMALVGAAAVGRRKS